MTLPLTPLRSKFGRRLLILFVGCALVPMAVLAYLSYRHVKQQLYRQSEHQLQQANLAARAGAAGVLLDTHIKDGLGLFGSLSRGEVAAWISAVRRSGLLTAVAGEIGPADLEMVQGFRPDVVGIRGAACDRGREGTVSVERVMALRRCMSPTRAVFHRSLA